MYHTLWYKWWRLKRKLKTLWKRLYRRGISVECLWQVNKGDPEAILQKWQPNELQIGNFHIRYNGRRLTGLCDSFDIILYEDERGDKYVKLYVPLGMRMKVIQ